MIKFRLYYDKDKETEFLNGMSRQGYAMKAFCAGFYSFDRCRPGEYIYQVDITEGFFRVSNDYREFMKDVGVEIICLWGPWVVLRKKAEEGSFLLYTDVESNYEHYTRIKKTFVMGIILEAVCVLVELLCALQGSMSAMVFAFMLAAAAAAMVFELVRVDRILAELKARLERV